MTVHSRGLLKRIILHSAKWPAVYLLIGTLFTALSLIDNIFPLPHWTYLFDLTDRLGSIFIALAFVVFFYNIFVFISLRYEKKLEHNYKVGSLILKSIRKSSRVIFILIALNIMLWLAAPSTAYLFFAKSFINAILIASIGWVALQILYTVEAVLYQYMSDLNHDQHVRIKALYTKMLIFRNILTVIIVVITIAAILMSFSSVRNIGISLLASAGFLTAIVGLAAQRTLFSLFSGIQIAISQPIKIGDIVVIEKESGEIEEITFTYVILKLGDRRRMVVPINYFTEKAFENWSRDIGSLRSSMHLFVDYMMPIEPLRIELDTILKASDYWDGRASKLQVANLTERCVDIRIQVSAANADDLSDLRAEVREKILTFIRENYPHYFPQIRLSEEF